MSNIPQPTTNQGQPDANTNQLMANVMPGNYQQKQTQLFEFTPEENLAIDLRAAELAKSTPEEEMRNIVEKMNPELQQSLAEEGLGPIMDYFRMLATKEFRRRRQVEADMDGNAGEMGQVSEPTRSRYLNAHHSYRACTNTKQVEENPLRAFLHAPTIPLLYY